MQQELVKLKEVRDAALEVTEAMHIPQKEGSEPLTLAGRLRRVPEPSRGLSPTLPVNT